MGSLGHIRRSMRDLRTEGLTWRQIGVVFGVSGGMAWRIVVESYEPKKMEIRRRLGLVRERRKKLDDLKVDELRRMLEERNEF